MQNVTILWLPGHINIPQITKIDEMAKHATSLQDIYHTELTSNEIIGKVDDWIWKEWVKDWKAKVTCRYQDVFELKREGYRGNNMVRIKETIVNRIRLLQTRLNSDLFKIGLHENGLCEKCQVKQDIFHFIYECSDSVILRDNLRYASDDQLSLMGLNEITTSKKLCNVLIDYILANKIDI